MPHLVRGALTLTCLLVPCVGARAGVYFTNSPEPFPVPTALMKVRDRLGTLRTLMDSTQIPPPPSSEERKKLVELVEKQLEPKLKKGELTLQDRVNLSAAYIRLNRHARAREVIESAMPQVKDDAPERFLLLANLAAAYHDGNDELLPRAIYAQGEALKAAPATPPLPGCSQEQWDHYRLAERYLLRLLELRRGEGVRARSWKTVDALFDKVKFVGPSGEYEAGKLSAENLHELPRDALPIVVQLLDWMPNDARLEWLYGEILNAEGEVNDAGWVLDDLRGNRSLGSIPELSRHRLVLKKAFRAPKEEEPPPPPPEDPKPVKAGIDWKMLGTGFLAGVLVAAFGGVQLYVWMRRRRAPALPSELDRSKAPSGNNDGMVPADPGHVTVPHEGGRDSRDAS